tara:strand:+ start:388 stop:591 length:204 start_codon:yes stop_codon:yes gene_type:complete
MVSHFLFLLTPPPSQDRVQYTAQTKFFFSSSWLLQKSCGVHNKKNDVLPLFFLFSKILSFFPQHSMK